MQRVHYSAIVLLGGMLASTAVCAQGVSNIQKPEKAAAVKTFRATVLWPVQ